ncbi:helix-turn-helix domain-containing protein [Nitrosomonas communis]|uniref:helix-turn-helix domain-containing protein n=1 Tax=Nitrosomonas communis TaxID=44574 RepID=UPI0009F4B06A
MKVPFADERKGYTRAFQRLVLELSRYMTIRGIAHYLGVSWDLVKKIYKRSLQKHDRFPN